MAIPGFDPGSGGGNSDKPKTTEQIVAETLGLGFTETEAGPTFVPVPSAPVYDPWTDELSGTTPGEAYWEPPPPPPPSGIDYFALDDASAYQGNPDGPSHDYVTDAEFFALPELGIHQDPTQSVPSGIDYFQLPTSAPLDRTPGAPSILDTMTFDLSAMLPELQQTEGLLGSYRTRIQQIVGQMIGDNPAPDSELGIALAAGDWTTVDRLVAEFNGLLADHDALYDGYLEQARPFNALMGQRSALIDPRGEGLVGGDQFVTSGYRDPGYGGLQGGMGYGALPEPTRFVPTALIAQHALDQQQLRAETEIRKMEIMREYYDYALPEEQAQMRLMWLTMGLDSSTTDRMLFGDSFVSGPSYVNPANVDHRARGGLVDWETIPGSDFLRQPADQVTRDHRGSSPNLLVSGAGLLKSGAEWGVNLGLLTPVQFTLGVLSQKAANAVPDLSLRDIGSFHWNDLGGREIWDAFIATAESGGRSAFTLVRYGHHPIAGGTVLSPDGKLRRVQGPAQVPETDFSMATLKRVYFEEYDALPFANRLALEVMLDPWGPMLAGPALPLIPLKAASKTVKAYDAAKVAARFQEYVAKGAIDQPLLDALYAVNPQPSDLRNIEKLARTFIGDSEKAGRIVGARPYRVQGLIAHLRGETPSDTYALAYYLGLRLAVKQVTHGKQTGWDTLTYNTLVYDTLKEARQFAVGKLGWTEAMAAKALPMDDATIDRIATDVGVLVQDVRSEAGVIRAIDEELDAIDALTMTKALPIGAADQPIAVGPLPIPSPYAHLPRRTSRGRSVLTDEQRRWLNTLDLNIRRAQDALRAATRDGAPEGATRIMNRRMQRLAELSLRAHINGASDLQGVIPRIDAAMAEVARLHDEYQLFLTTRASDAAAQVADTEATRAVSQRATGRGRGRPGLTYDRDARLLADNAMLHEMVEQFESRFADLAKQLDEAVKTMGKAVAREPEVPELAEAREAGLSLGLIQMVEALSRDYAVNLWVGIKELGEGRITQRAAQEFLHRFRESETRGATEAQLRRLRQVYDALDGHPSDELTPKGRWHSQVQAYLGRSGTKTVKGEAPLQKATLSEVNDLLRKLQSGEAVPGREPLVLTTIEEFIAAHPSKVFKVGDHYPTENVSKQLANVYGKGTPTPVVTYNQLVTLRNMGALHGRDYLARLGQGEITYKTADDMIAKAPVTREQLVMLDSFFREGRITKAEFDKAKTMTVRQFQNWTDPGERITNTDGSFRWENPNSPRLRKGSADQRRINALFIGNWDADEASVRQRLYDTIASLLPGFVIGEDFVTLTPVTGTKYFALGDGEVTESALGMPTFQAWLRTQKEAKAVKRSFAGSAIRALAELKTPWNPLEETTTDIYRHHVSAILENMRKESTDLGDLAEFAAWLSKAYEHTAGWSVRATAQIPNPFRDKDLADGFTELAGEYNRWISTPGVKRPEYAQALDFFRQEFVERRKLLTPEELPEAPSSKAEAKKWLNSQSLEETRLKLESQGIQIPESDAFPYMADINTLLIGRALDPKTIVPTAWIDNVQTMTPLAPADAPLDAAEELVGFDKRGKVAWRGVRPTDLAAYAGDAAWDTKLAAKAFAENLGIWTLRPDSGWARVKGLPGEADLDSITQWGALLLPSGVTPPPSLTLEDAVAGLRARAGAATPTAPAAPPTPPAPAVERPVVADNPIREASIIPTLTVTEDAQRQAYLEDFMLNVAGPAGLDAATVSALTVQVDMLALRALAEGSIQTIGDYYSLGKVDPATGLARGGVRYIDGVPFDGALGTYTRTIWGRTTNGHLINPSVATPDPRPVIGLFKRSSGVNPPGAPRAGKPMTDAERRQHVVTSYLHEHIHHFIDLLPDTKAKALHQAAFPDADLSNWKRGDLHAKEVDEPIVREFERYMKLFEDAKGAKTLKASGYSAEQIQALEGLREVFKVLWNKVKHHLPLGQVSKSMRDYFDLVFGDFSVTATGTGQAREYTLTLTKAVPVLPVSDLPPGRSRLLMLRSQAQRQHLDQLNEKLKGLDAKSDEAKAIRAQMRATQKALDATLAEGKAMTQRGEDVGGAAASNRDVPGPFDDTVPLEARHIEPRVDEFDSSGSRRMPGSREFFDPTGVNDIRASAPMPLGTDPGLITSNRKPTAVEEITAAQAHVKKQPHQVWGYALSAWRSGELRGAHVAADYDRQIQRFYAIDDYIPSLRQQIEKTRLIGVRNAGWLEWGADKAFDWTHLTKAAQVQKFVDLSGTLLRSLADQAMAFHQGNEVAFIRDELLKMTKNKDFTPLIERWPGAIESKEMQEALRGIARVMTSDPDGMLGKVEQYFTHLSPTQITAELLPARKGRWKADDLRQLNRLLTRTTRYPEWNDEQWEAAQILRATFRDKWIQEKGQFRKDGEWISGVTSETIDLALGTYDPWKVMDTEKFVENIAVAMGVREARRIGYDPMQLPLMAKLMMAVKNQMAPFWLALSIPYHVSTWAGNLAGWLLGQGRTDVTSPFRLSLYAMPKYHRTRDRLGTNVHSAYVQGIGARTVVNTRQGPQRKGKASGLARFDVEKQIGSPYSETRGLHQAINMALGNKVGPGVIGRIAGWENPLPWWERSWAHLPGAKHIVGFANSPTALGEQKFRDLVYGSAWEYAYNRDWAKAVYALDLDEAARKDLRDAAGLIELRDRMDAHGIQGVQREELKRAMNKTIANANFEGYAAARTMLRDYRMRNRIDGVLDQVFPIHFWATRNALFVGQTALQRPASIPAAFAIHQEWSDRRADLPPYLRDGYLGQIDLSGVSGGLIERPFHLRVVNYTNPAFWTLPKLLDRDKWDLSRDAGGMELINLMAVPVGNAYEAMGMRAGPHLDLAGRLLKVTIGATPLEDTPVGFNIARFSDWLAQPNGYKAELFPYHYVAGRYVGSVPGVGSDVKSAIFWLDSIATGDGFTRKEWAFKVAPVIEDVGRERGWSAEYHIAVLNELKGGKPVIPAWIGGDMAAIERQVEEIEGRLASGAIADPDLRASLEEQLEGLQRQLRRPSRDAREWLAGLKEDATYVKDEVYRREASNSVSARFGTTGLGVRYDEVRAVDEAVADFRRIMRENETGKGREAAIERFNESWFQKKYAVDSWMPMFEAWLVQGGFFGGPFADRERSLERVRAGDLSDPLFLLFAQYAQGESLRLKSLVDEHGNDFDTEVAALNRTWQTLDRWLATRSAVGYDTAFAQILGEPDENGEHRGGEYVNLLTTFAATDEWEDIRDNLLGANRRYAYLQDQAMTEHIDTMLLADRTERTELKSAVYDAWRPHFEERERIEEEYVACAANAGNNMANEYACYATRGRKLGGWRDRVDALTAEGALPDIGKLDKWYPSYPYRSDLEYRLRDPAGAQADAQSARQRNQYEFERRVFMTLPEGEQSEILEYAGAQDQRGYLIDMLLEGATGTYEKGLALYVDGERNPAFEVWEDRNEDNIRQDWEVSFDWDAYEKAVLEAWDDQVLADGTIRYGLGTMYRQYIAEGARETRARGGSWYLHTVPEFAQLTEDDLAHHVRNKHERFQAFREHGRQEVSAWHDDRKANDDWDSVVAEEERIRIIRTYGPEIWQHRDLSDEGVVDLRYKEGITQVAELYYSMTPADKAAFQERYAAFFVEVEAPPDSKRPGLIELKFDQRQLTTAAMIEILSEHGYAWAPTVNDPQAQPGWELEQSPESRQDEIARVNEATQVEALIDQSATVPLTLEEQERLQQWSDFTSNPLEAGAQALLDTHGAWENTKTGESGVSWKRVEKYLATRLAESDPSSEEYGHLNRHLEYVTARIALSEELAVKELRDKQSVWFNGLDEATQEMLLREAPNAFWWVKRGESNATPASDADEKGTGTGTGDGDRATDGPGGAGRGPRPPRTAAPRGGGSTGRSTGGGSDPATAGTGGRALPALVALDPALREGADSAERMVYASAVADWFDRAIFPLIQLAPQGQWRTWMSWLTMAGVAMVRIRLGDNPSLETWKLLAEELGGIDLARLDEVLAEVGAPPEIVEAADTFVGEAPAPSPSPGAPSDPSGIAGWSAEDIEMLDGAPARPGTGSYGFIP